MCDDIEDDLLPVDVSAAELAAGVVLGAAVWLLIGFTVWGLMG